MCAIISINKITSPPLYDCRFLMPPSSVAVRNILKRVCLPKVSDNMLYELILFKHNQGLTANLELWQPNTACKKILSRLWYASNKALVKSTNSV